MREAARGEAWMEGRLGYEGLFMGDGELRSLHSILQVERSHKTDTGLNHLNVKLLFLL